MNQESVNSITAFLKVHPVFSFVIAIFAATSKISHIDTMQVPVIVMQVAQLIAWIFVYITGAISILGFIEKKMGIKINLRFFKRKK